jgi:hypothetical protein
MSEAIEKPEFSDFMTFSMSLDMFVKPSRCQESLVVVERFVTVPASDHLTSVLPSAGDWG